jgi:hypothetical protein
MSDKQEPVIDADAVEEAQPSTSQPDEQDKVKTRKKRNFKLYFFLLLILGGGTWVFWTFSPQAQQLRMQFQSYVSQPGEETNTAQANTEEALETAPVSTPVEPTPEPVARQETTPLFETDITSTEQEQEQDNTEQTTSSEQGATTDFAANDPENNNPEIITSLQNLQQQVEDLTQAIASLQQQQLQWSQQQVRAQLFALLRQASSPQSNLEQRIVAWKSIGFLPLLSQDKRDIAEQAFTALQETQQHIQETETNIQSLIQALTSEIHPLALQDTSQDDTNVVDPYQQTDAFDSWLDWLKQQFVITKLDKHALELSDDPYADIKQLIAELKQLQTSIHQRNWEHIGRLTSLLYQLEQRGLEAEFSNESIANLQATIRQWQDEAKHWMAQL